VPCICEFDGIQVYMYDNGHRPPHFHVNARGEQAIIDIQTFDVTGQLRRPDRRKVMVWAQKRQAELLQNWTRIERKQPLERIDP
jgi:hypothetical protein